MLEIFSQPATGVALTDKCSTLLLQLGAEQVQFDASGALWLPETKTLVFSDLHLDKSNLHDAQGLFLPPHDTRRTLATMAQVMAHYRPCRVVVLGQSLPMDAGAGCMMNADADFLTELIKTVEWVWLVGPGGRVGRDQVAGIFCETINLAGLCIVAAPHWGALWQVAGGFHPNAKAARSGRSIRRRCFVSDGKRLIMPAFGAYTGGVNVLDTAFQGIFSADMKVHMIGEGLLWAVSLGDLQADNTATRMRH